MQVEWEPLSGNLPGPACRGRRTIPYALETLKFYVSSQGSYPYERQAAQIARRKAAAQATEKRLKELRLKWFRKLLGWAQTYVPMREDTLADLGLGRPLLRRVLRKLGARLVTVDILEQVGDV